MWSPTDRVTVKEGYGVWSPTDRVTVKVGYTVGGIHKLKKTQCFCKFVDVAYEVGGSTWAQ